MAEGRRLRNRRPVNYDESESPEPAPDSRQAQISPPLPSFLNTLQQDEFRSPKERRSSRSKGKQQARSRDQRPSSGNPLRGSSSVHFRTLFPQYESPEAQFADRIDLQGEVSPGLGRRALEAPKPFSPGYVPLYTDQPTEYDDSVIIEESITKARMEQVDGEWMVFVEKNDGRPGQYYKLGPDLTWVEEDGTKHSFNSPRLSPTDFFQESSDEPFVFDSLSDISDIGDSDEVFAQPGPSTPRDRTVQAYMSRPKDQTFQKHLKDSKDQTVQKYLKQAKSKKSWFPSWVPILGRRTKERTSKVPSPQRKYFEGLAPSRPASRSVKRGWLAPVWNLKYTLDDWLPWWWLRIPASLYLFDKWLWNVYLFFESRQDKFAEEPSYLVLAVNSVLMTLFMRIDRPFLSAVGTILSWIPVVAGLLRSWVIGPGFGAAKWLCIIGTTYVVIMAHIAVFFVLWNFFGSGSRRSERSSMVEQAGIPSYLVRAARMFGIPVP